MLGTIWIISDATGALRPATPPPVSNSPHDGLSRVGAAFNAMNERFDSLIRQIITQLAVGTVTVESEQTSYSIGVPLYCGPARHSAALGGKKESRGIAEYGREKNLGSIGELPTHLRDG